MKKAEYIEKYGEEAYAKKLEKDRERLKKWRDNNKEKRKAWDREYYKVIKDKKAEYRKNYYAENKKKILAHKQEYDILNKDKIRTQAKKYYAANREKRLSDKKKWSLNNPEYEKQYYLKNKKDILIRRKTWVENNPKNSRAAYLIGTYNAKDKNRSFYIENNVSVKWIIDNIFSGQKCVYCGDGNWRHLGCDRIDNSKPHTPDNVVCACGLCNIERSDRYTVEEFKQYRALHPRECDLPKKPSVELSENGALKKRVVPKG